MGQADAVQMVNVDLDTLVEIIRQVVREEVGRAMSGSRGEPGVVHLEPGSPLYEGMEDLLRRKQEGRIRLHTHAEVWGE
jgi:hypothetical protein